MKWSRVLVFFLLSSAIPCLAKGFYEQRYRGWLWFEEKERDTSQNLTEHQQNNSSAPTNTNCNN